MGVETTGKKQTVHRINTTNSLGTCLYNEIKQRKADGERREICAYAQIPRLVRVEYYYEIYIDSLFLINFAMNFWVLLLVDNSLHRTATRCRLLLGAVVGGLGYCLMFLLPIPYAIGKLLFGAVGVNSAMLFIVFRPHTFQVFWKLIERLTLCTFLFGGAFFLLINHVQVFRKNLLSLTGILLCGGLLWMFLSHKGKKKKDRICRVEIFGEAGRKITVQAIVDSGNSLREPISGKPVSVLDEKLFMALWEKEPEGFRAIPYHSVGCDRGIMKGYEVPRMIVEWEGIRKECVGIYVGLSQTLVSEGYQMLIHPAILE